MRILLITPAFVPSTYGGVKNCVYNLSKAFLKRGHEVTVYTSNAYNEKVNLLIEGRHDVESIHTVYCKNCFPKKYWFTPSMSHYLKMDYRKFDIIHMHNNFGYQNIIAYNFARKQKIPYLFSSHGALLKNGEWNIKKFIYNLLIGNSISKHASRIVTLTEFEEEYWRTRGINTKKIEIIPNGINLSEYKKLPQKGTFRKKYNINKKEKLILYLGRIHKIKGLKLLVKAFDEVLKHIKETKLVIIGPDFGYLSTIKKLIRSLKIEDKVIIIGYISGDEKLSAYIDSNVFVLPSIYETFPTTVLEAWGCGVPVIITDRCGIANIVKKEKAGLVIPYNESDLSNALSKLLTNSRLREEIRCNTKILVKEQFNWNKISEKLEKIYKNVIKESIQEI